MVEHPVALGALLDALRKRAADGVVALEYSREARKRYGGLGEHCRKDEAVLWECVRARHQSGFVRKLTSIACPAPDA